MNGFLVRQFSGPGPWSQRPIIVPGHEVRLQFITASDYGANNDPAATYGFGCAVTGHVSDSSGGGGGGGGGPAAGGGVHEELLCCATEMIKALALGTPTVPSLSTNEGAAAAVGGGGGGLPNAPRPIGRGDNQLGGRPVYEPFNPRVGFGAAALRAGFGAAPAAAAGGFGAAAAGGFGAAAAGGFGAAAAGGFGAAAAAGGFGGGDGAAGGGGSCPAGHALSLTTHSEGGYQTGWVRKTPSFLSFSYICPEPVLAK